MEIITSNWHRIVFIISLIVVAVKLNAQVKEIQKDIDNIEKRDTYVETVKLRAEVDQQKSQMSALWDYNQQDAR